MRKVLIIFFLLFIISIPIGLLTGIGSSVELTEKRSPAPFPELSLARAIDKDLYSQLDKYFSDSFVFRAPLVKAKNWIDFFIFKSSPSKRVHVGRDGWLFYTKTLNGYLKNSCEHREDARKVAWTLHVIERRLAKKGQLFLFVIAPNKATIYPEYVGLTRPKQDCNRSDYDLLLEAFNEFPVRGFIRLDKLFIDAKKEGGPLYHKTDTHWNLKGERIAIKEIVRYIETTNARMQGRTDKAKNWKRYMPRIEYSKEFRSGDLAGMMSLKIDEPIEGIKKIHYKSTTTTEELAPLKTDAYKRRHFRSKSTPLPNESLLPGAIIFGDSFMNEPLKILKGSFESLNSLRSYNIYVEEGKDDLKNSPIVILEMVERNLYFMY